MSAGTVSVFGYGSLVAASSAAATLGRERVEVVPADLEGWRRSWSLRRDNRHCEKTFARPDGSIPDVVIALDVAPAAGSTVNGALIAVTADELERLDRREIRYERVDVSGDVVADLSPRPGRVCTYVAKAANHVAEPPADSVILATYERAVETAFEGLGPGQLARFRATTVPSDVERIEPTLVADSIPPGNPRGW